MVRYSNRGPAMRAFGAIGALSALLFITPSPAQAYIDPGASGMVLQLVVGALVGGVASLMVVTKLYWGRVKTMLGFDSTETDSIGTESASISAEDGAGEENEAREESDSKL